jgi:hypothetical protein
MVEYSQNTTKIFIAIGEWNTKQYTTTCFGHYRPSSGCTISLYEVNLHIYVGCQLIVTRSRSREYMTSSIIVLEGIHPPIAIKIVVVF